MKFRPLLSNFNLRNEYHPVDLSKSTLHELDVDPQNHESLQAYLTQLKKTKKAKVLYGGYLEKRSLYNQKELFRNHDKQRNIHLGVDFWADAGEEVICPKDAIVHSFSDNQGIGNYGPCIILKHKINGEELFSLYGHLSRESLLSIKVGQLVEKSQVFCELGTSEENGGYLPHLHFQLIKNMENYKGDYPGVCHENNLEFYKNNTLNPEIFLDL